MTKVLQAYIRYISFFFLLKNKEADEAADAGN